MWCIGSEAIIVQVSSSNKLAEFPVKDDSTPITVSTSDPVLWTIELRIGAAFA